MPRSPATYRRRSADTAAVDAGTTISGTADILGGGHVTDADAGDSFYVSAVKGAADAPLLPGPADRTVTAHGSYGNLTINEDGSYSYKLNAAVDALAAGVQATDVFTYDVTDSTGLSSQAHLTFNVTGANDNPVGRPSPCRPARTSSRPLAATISPPMRKAIR